MLEHTPGRTNVQHVHSGKSTDNMAPAVVSPLQFRMLTRYTCWILLCTFCKVDADLPNCMFAMVRACQNAVAAAEGKLTCAH